jgi:hypothetical protein
LQEMYHNRFWPSKPQNGAPTFTKYSIDDSNGTIFLSQTFSFARRYATNVALGTGALSFG